MRCRRATGGSVHTGAATRPGGWAERTQLAPRMSQTVRVLYALSLCVSMLQKALNFCVSVLQNAAALGADLDLLGACSRPAAEPGCEPPWAGRTAVRG